MSPAAAKQQLRQFVFGYGSLINPASRAITNPSLAGDAIPILLTNVERIWNARSIGWTAMGVRFRDSATCNGVLLEIPSKQALRDLDQREANYIRLEVELRNVHRVPYLEQQQRYYETEAAKVISTAKENEQAQSNSKNKKTTTDVKVWLYVQKDPIPADASHPIPQSYVDIILQGCWTYSTDFATQFMETTRGWPSDDSKNAFVNDRHCPIYSRADMKLSNDTEFMQRVDDLLLLKQHHRVDYDPKQHVKSLKLQGSSSRRVALLKAQERVGVSRIATNRTGNSTQ